MSVTSTPSNVVSLSDRPTAAEPRPLITIDPERARCLCREAQERFNPLEAQLDLLRLITKAEHARNNVELARQLDFLADTLERDQTAMMACIGGIVTILHEAALEKAQ